jgi:hypothetical protein
MYSKAAHVKFFAQHKMASGLEPHKQLEIKLCRNNVKKLAI